MRNLLPHDGEALYFGPILDRDTADAYYIRLLQQTAWQHDEVILFGQRRTTRRKVAWYGDAVCTYRYAGVSKTALPWFEDLMWLRHQVERMAGNAFNSCLLNLYHDGTEAMGWHADAEKELLPDGAIVSLSLGAERRFSFKHRTNATRTDVLLEHGSLLIMQGAVQRHWVHCLPLMKKVKEPRINLTFRTILTKPNP